jgi:outer membrane protein OmpA-like peptidoglycan-associated protein
MPTLAARVLAVAIAITVAAPALARDGGAEPSGDAGAMAPLKIAIDKSKVDLSGHRLALSLSRDAAKIAIKVIGDSGAVLADEEHDAAGAAAGATIVVTWTPSSDEPVAKIEVRAFDTAGYWAGVALVPWSVSIPHQEVNFKTGSAKIEDGEKPKLEDSYAKIADVVAKHGDLGTITLFIAGHTDTVGRPQDNFRLSEQRARAIAGWFRQRGLSIPIAYEGFGESSLLVKTPDETDEPRNRRVDYILALDEPSIRAVGFRPSWKRAR